MFNALGRLPAEARQKKCRLIPQRAQVSAQRYFEPADEHLLRAVGWKQFETKMDCRGEVRRQALRCRQTLESTGLPSAAQQKSEKTRCPGYLMDTS